MRGWGEKLHGAWKFLGRKIKSNISRNYFLKLFDFQIVFNADDVRDNPELYSMIYVPHPFIIPGGRFREIYYWDSYWIVQGLLISQMNHTVKIFQ